MAPDRERGDQADGGENPELTVGTMGNVKLQAINDHPAGLPP
jgi:hypothetical protein